MGDLFDQQYALFDLGILYWPMAEQLTEDVLSMTEK